MSEDNYTGVLLEQIQDQNKAVLEAVGMMRNDMNLLAKQVDLEEVKQDVKAIKFAVKATNKQVQDHEKRITLLEAKA